MFARVLCLLFPGVLAVAACSQSAPSTNSSDSNIEGGGFESGYPQVGLLTLDVRGICTGALIASDVVLTAGHCIDNHQVKMFLTGSGVPSEVGGQAPSNMIPHEIEDTSLHDQFRRDPLVCPKPWPDVGLVKLRNPIRDITPLAFRASGTPALNSPGIGVGFGGFHDDAGNPRNQAKRSATMMVAEVRDTSLKVTKGSGHVMPGDSGGPLLFDNVIVGTTSCKDLNDDDNSTDHYFNRIDNGIDWIKRQLATWNHSVTVADSGVARILPDPR